MSALGLRTARRAKVPGTYMYLARGGRLLYIPSVELVVCWTIHETLLFCSEFFGHLSIMSSSHENKYPALLAFLHCKRWKLGGAWERGWTYPVFPSLLCIDSGPHSRFSRSWISSLSSQLGLSAPLLVQTLEAINSAQPCFLNLFVVGPCPPYVHLMSLTWWILPGLTVVCCSSTSMSYYQCKVKNERWGSTVHAHCNTKTVDVCSYSGMW